MYSQAWLVDRFSYQPVAWRFKYHKSALSSDSKISTNEIIFIKKSALPIGFTLAWIGLWEPFDYTKWMSVNLSLDAGNILPCLSGSQYYLVSFKIITQNWIVQFLNQWELQHLQSHIQIKTDHLVLQLPEHADHLPTSHQTNCPPHHCEHQVIEPLHLSPHPYPGYSDSMVFTQEKLGNTEHTAPMKPKPDLMLDLSVMVKFMKVAMLMELEVWPSTASKDQVVHCSTRTISSVTGGSMLNVRHLLLMLLVVLELLQIMLLEIVLLRMTCSTSTWTTLAASPSLSV